jgi:hypothetical protein
MSVVKIRHSYFSLGKIRVLRLTARGAPHIVVSLPSESTISEFNLQEQTETEKIPALPFRLSIPENGTEQHLRHLPLFIDCISQT